MRRRIALGAAIGLGLGSLAVLLLIWWVGLYNGWAVRLEWNNYGEAWLEGVLLHLGALFVVVVFLLTPRWLK